MLYGLAEPVCDEARTSRNMNKTNTNKNMNPVKRFINQSIVPTLLGKVYYHTSIISQIFYSSPSTTPPIVYALLKPLLYKKVKICLIYEDSQVAISPIKPGIYKRFFDKHNFVVINIYQKSTNEFMENLDNPAGLSTGTTEFMVHDIWMVGPNYRYYLEKAVTLSNKLCDASHRYFRNHSANDVILNICGELIKIKALDEIVLDKSVKHKLLSELDAFMTRKEYYFKNHIKYKFGILFHGAPGTGKTSLAYALVKELRAEYMVITEDDLTEYIIQRNRSSKNKINSFNPLKINHPSVNAPQIYIIDEFDSIIKHVVKNEEYGKVEYDDRKSNTPSSMLTKRNLLDIIDNGFPEGSIIIATTNDYEYLLSVDKAFIRPGRFDLHLELDTFDRDRAMEMIIQRGLDEEFANSIEYPVVPSKLEYLINQELYARGEKLKEGHD